MTHNSQSSPVTAWLGQVAPPATPKRFGLSAAELRAKREAKRAERAERERQIWIDALVDHVEWALSLPHRHILPIETDNIYFEITNNALLLHAEMARRRGYREMRDEMICDSIRESYRPLIEAARLENAGSATKRALKRQAKEAKRQSRAEHHPAA